MKLNSSKGKTWLRGASCVTGSRYAPKWWAFISRRTGNERLTLQLYVTTDIHTPRERTGWARESRVCAEYFFFPSPFFLSFSLTLWSSNSCCSHIVCTGSSTLGANTLLTFMRAHKVLSFGMKVCRLICARCHVGRSFPI